MKKYLLTGLFIMFSFALFAQSAAKDTLQQWKEKRTQLSRLIDSLKIIVPPQHENIFYMDQKKRDCQEDLNAEIKQGVLAHKVDQAKMDSLSVQLKLVSVIRNGMRTRLDNTLIQLDSCITAQDELDRKIGLVQPKAQPN